MIYTVTFNPSVDCILKTPSFAPGISNRAEAQTLRPGGKGINVSAMLRNLGLSSVALGFTSGFTGAWIEDSVKSGGVNTDFIPLSDGFTRINVKIKGEDETEINAPGPNINEENIKSLIQKLDCLKQGDILILSGSVPPSVSDDIYLKLSEKAKSKNALTVVDAEKKLLLNALSQNPFLVKPNNHELGDMFSVKLKTRSDVIPYAEALRDKGALNVLVSCGKDGAVLAAADGRLYQAPAPGGKVVNSVGAGDSMVAGFIAGYLENGSYEHAFKMGLSAGSATALSCGLGEKEAVMSLYKTIK